MNISKRNLVKTLATSGVIGAQFPSEWGKPSIKSVVLPAHAGLSGVYTGIDLQILEQTGGTVELYTDISFSTQILPGQDVGTSYVMLIESNPVLANTQITIETFIDDELVNTFFVTTNGSGVAAVEVGQVGGSLLAGNFNNRSRNEIADFSLISDANAAGDGSTERIRLTAADFVLAFRYILLRLGGVIDP